MANPLIGAGPEFDPDANAKSTSSSLLRGNRWLMFVAGAVVAGGGMFAVNAWLGDLFHSDNANAAIEVKPSRGDITAFNLQPINLPVTAANTPPPKKLETVEEKVDAPTKRQPPIARPSSSGGAKAELPKAISWSVEVAGGQNMDWFADGRIPHLAHGCALRPGPSIIPAVLVGDVQSETAGQVRAMVSEDVLNVDGVIDPRTGRTKVLIPQGSFLIGTYTDNLDLNSRRLGIVWTQVTKPNGGGQIMLGEAPGMDVAGAMGVGGEVTTAWGQVIMVAAVFSVFQAAQQATVPDGTYASELADASVNQFSRTGQQVIGKVLDGAVKIKIPGGTPIIVSVSRTIQVC